MESQSSNDSTAGKLNHPRAYLEGPRFIIPSHMVASQSDCYMLVPHGELRTTEETQPPGSVVVEAGIT